MKILSIFGTRPEAIKMAPLIIALQNESGVQSEICITGQHKSMLDPLLVLFGLRPDYDLSVMQPNQGLNQLAAKVMANLDAVLETATPDCVLVHGDTTSAMASALAAFHRKIPVGHIEAGLRTHTMSEPFPEEMNRRVVDTMGAYLFAPTISSKENLVREHVQGRVWVTGNTVIDALAAICLKLQDEPALQSALESRYGWLDPERKLVLVTGHRRENFGEGLLNICSAIAELAQNDELQIVYPVHLNPNVQLPVRSLLGELRNVHLLEPLDYLEFSWLMQHAHIILTDSGGIQEEAPYLGKPVLVMRDVTERPEAVAAGTAMLVGTSPVRIVTAVNRLISDSVFYSRFSEQANPYGDGKASARIVAALCGRPVDEFQVAPVPTHGAPTTDTADSLIYGGSRL